MAAHDLATALAATSLEEDANPLRALPEGVLGLSLEKLHARDGRLLPSTGVGGSSGPPSGEAQRTVASSLASVSIVATSRAWCARW